MSDLQNLTPANTYKALLQIGDYTDGISGDTGGNALQVTDGAGNNTALAISTDRVGIGTTSPSQELDVNGDIASTTLTTSGAVTAGSVSTSGAVGAGSIDVSGNVVADEYALDQTGSSSSAVAIHAPTTNELAIRTNTAERVRIDSSGNVGIGTTTPNAKLTLPLTESIHFNNSSGVTKAEINSGSAGTLEIQGDFDLRFSTTSEAMRIDSSGNVGIGTDSPQIKLHVETSETSTYSTTSLGANADRLTRFRTKNNSQVDGQFASIGLISSGDNGTSNAEVALNCIQETDTSTSSIFTIQQRKADTTYHETLRIDSSGNVLPGTDDAQDLGSSSKRWDDIYATNTTIQSSDRELKQDIEKLSEAETRVAQACKGLLRKYRWKDAVAQKGDEARIHFGIIAQDLEDAFTAEGLDACRYGMFVKNTWWTADRVIPAVEAVEAVEAVYDEEGNELSPAVEAVEAQPERTVTDIFNNSEDAPEGATEVTQRGVRYSELLAFIISAI